MVSLEHAFDRLRLILLQCKIDQRLIAAFGRRKYGLMVEKKD